MSAQSSAPLSSSAPSPPPTSSPNSPLSNTSTLLFGFLVSALSVFAVFMTVAIIWNRLVARRRAIDATLAMNPPSYPQQLHRPTMWDIWSVPDEQLPRWADVKPLAVQRCNDPPSSLRATQTAHNNISLWRRRLLGFLPPEITYLFRRPMPEVSVASSDTDIPHVELPHGSDTQISLLICMPRASLAKREQMFHEMVLATTNSVYHDPGSS